MVRGFVEEKEQNLPLRFGLNFSKINLPQRLAGSSDVSDKNEEEMSKCESNRPAVKTVWSEADGQGEANQERF